VVAAQPSAVDAAGQASFILAATAAVLEEALQEAAVLVALVAVALAAAALEAVGNWNPIETKLKKKA
jgi:hypothetical protein